MEEEELKELKQSIIKEVTQKLEKCDYYTDVIDSLGDISLAFFKDTGYIIEFSSALKITMEILKAMKKEFNDNIIEKKIIECNIELVKELKNNL